MDKCELCGAKLRENQVALCKTCRQNLQEGQVHVVKAPDVTPVEKAKKKAKAKRATMPPAKTPTNPRKL